MADELTRVVENYKQPKKVRVGEDCVSEFQFDYKWAADDPRRELEWEEVPDAEVPWAELEPLLQGHMNRSLLFKQGDIVNVVIDKGPKDKPLSLHVPTVGLADSTALDGFMQPLQHKTGQSSAAPRATKGSGRLTGGDFDADYYMDEFSLPEKMAEYLEDQPIASIKPSPGGNFIWFDCDKSEILSKS
eukprot:COSAG02_NODE_1464_length_12487_cov_122.573297_2_plen_188_part_00